MEIRYIGPYDRVYVPLPTGGGLEVDQGDVLTVPDDLGEQLLEQATNWTSIVDPSEAKVDELKAELERRGIAYPAKAKRDDLLELIAKADDPPAPEQTPEDTGGSPPDQAGNGETT